MKLEMSAPPVRRIISIDILRGLVMVIMAIDHIRDFFSPTGFNPTDLDKTNVPLFLTRWITHFCAPTFVFLSGISIFLYQQKKSDKKQTSRFLLTRGLWLVIVEIVFVSFFLTWGYRMIALQVIWIFGIGMMLMAALIWLPRWCLMLVAIIIIAGHNAIPHNFPPTGSALIPAFLSHSPFAVPGTPVIFVAYSIIPWLGVMLLGYVIGPWFLLSEDVRKRRLILAGLSALLLFILLRWTNIYGDDYPWKVQSRGWAFTILSFINVTKYPPSLLYDCLTIGTAFIFLYLFELGRLRIYNVLLVFGQVPFFYYVLHIATISSLAFVWMYVRFDKIVNLAIDDPANYPPAYYPSLLRVYLYWLAIMALLYRPCKWFANYRKTHSQWWLSYL